jgi:hypothetical protein
MVARARHTLSKSTVSQMKRTDPSPRVTFTPPGCRLRAAAVLLAPLSPLMQGRFSCGWLSHQPRSGGPGCDYSAQLRVDVSCGDASAAIAPRWLDPALKCFTVGHLFRSVRAPPPAQGPAASPFALVQRARRHPATQAEVRSATRMYPGQRAPPVLPRRNLSRYANFTHVPENSRERGRSGRRLSAVTIKDDRGDQTNWIGSLGSGLSSRARRFLRPLCRARKFPARAQRPD